MTNFVKNNHWDWHSAYPAPAKLNLFLHVTGRRADGYHTLQTLFRFIDYADTVHFSPREDTKIVLAKTLPDVPPEHDLTWRAARLLQEASGCQKGVTITLEKYLPMGGGLGGGSSDAATVLLALNHLWQTGLSRQELQAIGLQLGADVPVFIFAQNAFAEGIGEDLQAIPLNPAWYVLLEPAVAVPTARIFQDPQLTRNTPAIRACDWHPRFGHNDLQAVACAHFPEVASALQTLSRFAPARMTGSGACIFAEFSAQSHAEAVCAKLPYALRAQVVAGLAAHPLRAL